MHGRTRALICRKRLLTSRYLEKDACTSCYHPTMVRHESEFFNETRETKPFTYTCPNCKHRDEYQVRWVRRVKKAQPPRGSDAHDRQMFTKLQNYLVRVDDFVMCTKCGRRFEIPSHQNLVFFGAPGNKK